MLAPIGYKTLFINSRMDVYPCHLLPEAYCFGNAINDTLEEIFTSPQAVGLLKRLKHESICRYCLNNCDIRNLVTEESFSFLSFLVKSPAMVGNLIRGIRQGSFAINQLF